MKDRGLIRIRDHVAAVAVVAVAPLERACSRNKVAPAGSNGVKADQVCFKERGKTELHKRNGKIWNLCQSPPRLPNCRESRNNGGEDRFLRFLPTLVKNEHDKLLAVPVLRSVITLGHGSRDFETPALNHKRRTAAHTCKISKANTQVSLVTWIAGSNRADIATTAAFPASMQHWLTAACEAAACPDIVDGLGIGNMSIMMIKMLQAAGNCESQSKELSQFAIAARNGQASQRLPQKRQASSY